MFPNELLTCNSFDFQLENLIMLKLKLKIRYYPPGTPENIMDLKHITNMLTFVVEWLMADLENVKADLENFEINPSDCKQIFFACYLTLRPATHDRFYTRQSKLSHTCRN